MPNYIQPTLSLKTNSHVVSSLPGPTSIALSLTATDQLTVDTMIHETVETSGTLNVNSAGENGPINGSALAEASGADADGNDNVTAGTVGGYVYMKNNSSTTNENIFIGIAGSSGETDPQAPAAPAAAGSGGTTTCLDNDTHDTLRTFTLKPGEFAWFPWDYTGDINWQAQTGTPQLEYWIFDRA